MYDIEGPWSCAGLYCMYGTEWGWVVYGLRSSGLHIILRSNPLASSEQPRSSLCIYFGLLCSFVPPTQFLANTHAHTVGGSSKEQNVTSLSLYSHIRGDEQFSGFLRTSANCYCVGMDSFRSCSACHPLFTAQTLKVSPF